MPPLEKRESLEYEQQRQSDVVFRAVFNDGIWKPEPHIGLALASSSLELIETEARNYAAQEGLGSAHPSAVGAHPTHKGFLKNVLGVSHGSQHSVGDAPEHWTQRVEEASVQPSAARSRSE